MFYYLNQNKKCIIKKVERKIYFGKKLKIFFLSSSVFYDFVSLINLSQLKD
jgi:hypothetical protein